LTRRSALPLPLYLEPLKLSEHEIRYVNKRLPGYETQLEQALPEDLKSHPSFEASYCRSYTVMYTMSEGQMLIGCALELKLIGVGKSSLIAIPRRQNEEQCGTLW
jgi:hypothetical protein